jgi:tetratricopeptide (TPR) repeat protein
VLKVESDLVARAWAAYEHALRDPSTVHDLDELVAACRDRRESEALVVALRAQAWCARHRLATAEAKAYLDEAVRLAGRARLVDRLVEVLATRAAVNHELGRIAAAQRDLDRARSFPGRTRSPDLEFQQAVLHHNVGRLTQAAALYADLLELPQTPPEMRVKAANNLALIETHGGHYDDALARLDSVRDDARSLGPALVAIVEDSRGWVLVQGGRLVEGLRGLAEAAERHREAGLPLGEHYLEHCDALTDLRLLPEAFAMATRAEQEFSSRGVGLLAAEAQLRLARLGRLAGRPSVAEAAGRTAGEMFRRHGRTAWAAQARVLELEARAAHQEPTADDARALRRAARSL